LLSSVEPSLAPIHFVDRYLLVATQSFFNNTSYVTVTLLPKTGFSIFQIIDETISSSALAFARGLSNVRMKPIVLKGPNSVGSYKSIHFLFVVEGDMK
jgi:hypothetical protein